MAYITSLRPEFVTTTNLMNHILIVWKSYTALPIRGRQFEKVKGVYSNTYLIKTPGMAVVAFEWKEGNCTEEMNRGLMHSLFSSISSQVLPFPPVDHETLSLSHYCVKSFLFLGFFFFFFRNGKNTWVTMKHQYNEKTRSLLFEVFLTDCMF